MFFLKKVTILISLILFLPIPSSAYVIPSEYRDLARNEVEVYILASSHQGEPWADSILYEQMCQQVGCKAINGREKLDQQMEYYMQFYYVPKMPEIPVLFN